MRVKDFKARYAELDPFVIFHYGDSFFECKLSLIPPEYDYFENVRYNSDLGKGGVYRFRVWANTPSEHYLPHYADYDDARKYFEEYCKDIDFRFINYWSHDNKYFLLESEDIFDDIRCLQLLYFDPDSDMEDMVFLSSCDSRNQAEWDLLKLAFETLTMFEREQDRRIESFRVAKCVDD